MTDIHHYITELLKGNVLPGEPPFSLDSNFRAVDREDYLSYLPALCRFIETEKDLFKRSIARLVLERIIPDKPDLAIANCLLKGLEDPDRITRDLLLSHIEPLLLPDGTNIEPIKQCVRKGDFLERTSALKALRAAPGIEGELFLLEVLRRTDNFWDIETIAVILGDIGSVFSLPVLMARLENETMETDELIYQALEKIASRLEMPSELREQLGNPDFWKVNWQGTKESFMGFMAMVTMISGNSDNPEAEDQLGEIFREEMHVDIAPFRTYRELRLCSNDEDMFGAMVGIEESLQSRILLEVALSNAGISESRESQFEGIYFNMLNDYLFTRLRRKIRFADDDF
ncbi:hypothetical protein FMM05_20720 [Flavobacterium zepuense]|uniref:HEAT repeat domain-containing protein n=1 Tax=Flavobacterium zepuense TaxID=2593302 RepID=A0A552USB7_9FLAO|nr:hypothetical protein [Flavobacterium zepuense]TRW21040.1 hypothetical protein FMM05_20720 [Flavobacterium zepuense]